ncbi:MAG: hypothetical protein JJE30_02345 [Desulfuromonadales bacterium]|nr:hypothetical protein [Desulfuromonadales bacterium]
MPIATLWGLVVSLALLALGMAYTIAELRHSLTKSKDDTDVLRKSLVSLEDDRKKEASSLRAEIDTLKDDFNKTISSIKELHQRETEELRNKILELTKQTHNEPTSETKYLTTGPYKWAVTVYKSGKFNLDEYPICKDHDLKFIFGSQSKYCPCGGCHNNLSDYDAFKVEETVKSIIERNIRTGEWPEV